MMKAFPYRLYPSSLMCLFLILGILGMQKTTFSQQVRIDLDPVLFGVASQEFSNGSTQVISTSMGETMIETVSNNDLIITEGFQQSNYILTNPYILELISTPEECVGANNGTVSVDFISNNMNPPFSYQWNTGDTNLSVGQLSAGTYTLIVTDSKGRQVTNMVEVGLINEFDCTPRFYTGITPNNDGDNDRWIIENAEFFDERKVQVFNRYGDLVWEAEEYDNANPFEGNHLNGAMLPDGTYYYVASFNGVMLKGFVEISR